MEWVKCSTRMPLWLSTEQTFRSVEVLVSDGINIGTCECQSGNSPSAWVAFSNYGDIPADKITHWMPYPELPTE